VTISASYRSLHADVVVPLAGTRGWGQAHDCLLSSEPGQHILPLQTLISPTRAVVGIIKHVLYCFTKEKI